ncbi:MAG: c-type cytochrome [Pirellulales bacterium]
MRTARNDCAPVYKLLIAGLLLPVFALIGCAREEPLVYSNSAEFREEVEAFFDGIDGSESEIAQQKKDLLKVTNELLQKFYGTPANPRLLVPSLDPDADVDDLNVDEVSFLEPSKGFDDDTLKLGASVFRQRCAACHGITGDGLGPAAEYLDPKPRDYRKGVFKFISTKRGKKPRRNDLDRIVRWGAKGTSMPSFRWLPEDEFKAVVNYVIVLSQRGELERSLAFEELPEMEPGDEYFQSYVYSHVQAINDEWDVPLTDIIMPEVPRPPTTEETIMAGRKSFIVNNCIKCHGVDNKGDRKIDVGKDDWGETAYAADLTLGALHGGRRPADLYRRVHQGINGTPMPGQGNITYKDKPEEIWAVVDYVLAVVDGREFDPADLDKYLPPEEPAPATSSSE